MVTPDLDLLHAMNSPNITKFLCWQTYYYLLQLAEGVAILLIFFVAQDVANFGDCFAQCI